MEKEFNSLGEEIREENKMTKEMRECDTNEWEVNSANSDALCFESDETKRNTEICKDCPYNKMGCGIK